MINLPMDLHGLLSLLWKPEYAEDLTVAPFDPTQKHYMDANEDLQKEVDAATINRYLWLLNPDTFRKWATPPQDPGFLKASGRRRNRAEGSTARAIEHVPQRAGGSATRTIEHVPQRAGGSTARVINRTRPAASRGGKTTQAPLLLS